MNENNKRIAKNTLYLYFRMLLIMGVSLYTSRIVLQSLGVVDFGIYNVVGGVVAMFWLFSGSMSAAIGRFLTFELAKNDIDRLKKIFSSAILIQLFCIFLVIIIAESVGLWFLNNKMDIPVDRMEAANWVFQFSILTFCINLISIPYSAAIMAHERVSVFALVSIFESVGIFVVAYIVSVSTIDKLILYAILVCSVSLFIRIIYGFYCKKHFQECVFTLFWDKQIIKQMMSFSGFNFIGASSSILRDHGGNIIINLFCGPAVNAARGISTQVSQAVGKFSDTFMAAVNPQITKSFARGDKEYMMFLILWGAKLSFFMLMILSLPILLNTEYILSIWLGEFPQHAVSFVQLILLFSLNEAFSKPLITAMLATGDIRNYQIIVGSLNLMNLPLSYFFLRNGFPPEFVLFVAIFCSLCCLFARIILLRKMIGLNFLTFLKVIFKAYLVFILSATISLIVKREFCFYDSFGSFFVLTITSFLFSCFFILFFGCGKTERKIIFAKLIELKGKIIHP